MKRLIEVHVAGIKWLSRLASARLSLCLLFPSLPSFSLSEFSLCLSTHSLLHLIPIDWPRAELTVLSLSLRCNYPAHLVSVVQGVNQSFRSGTSCQWELCKMIYCPAILRQKYLRKLVATVDVVSCLLLLLLRRCICAIHQPTNCCPATAPTVCNRMRQGIPFPSSTHTCTQTHQHT